MFVIVSYTQSFFISIFVLQLHRMSRSQISAFISLIICITILSLVAFQWPVTVAASPSPPSSSTECVRKWIDGQSINPSETHYLNNFWRCTNTDPSYAVDSEFSQYHKPWVAIDSNHPDFVHLDSDDLYNFANEQCLDLTNDPEAVARYPMDRHAKVVFDIAGRIMDFSAEWREDCKPYISLLSQTKNPAYSKCTPSASACAIPVDMNECLSYTGHNCAHIMDSAETHYTPETDVAHSQTHRNRSVLQIAVVCCIRWSVCPSSR